MRNYNCYFWLKSFLILITGFLLAACGNSNSMRKSNSHNEVVSSSACVGNAYLQKYGCSMRRIENAARSGDPDAQYALGYMYYYGIGTTKDKETARLWIGRAAKQGQPLARRAETLMNGGQELHSLHPRYQSQYDAARSRQDGGSNSGHRNEAARRANQYTPTPSVDELNTSTPDKPLNQVLPNYGKKPDTQSGQESVIKSLRKKPSTPAPAESSPNGTKPSVEPITRLHDQRLMPNSKPNSFASRMPYRIARGSMTAVERQMMVTPRKHYTLQLMSGRNLGAIKAFIRQHNLEGRAYYYSASLNSKPWYMLIYGNYTNARMARMAAQQLPSSLQSMHPWVKSYRVVQDEIRLRRLVT